MLVHMSVYEHVYDAKESVKCLFLSLFLLIEVYKQLRLHSSSLQINFFFLQKCMFMLMGGKDSVT